MVGFFIFGVPFFVLYQLVGNVYCPYCLEYVIYGNHFLFCFSLFWVRSNLLYWELGSQNMCPKLLGLSLPGVGKCSDHLSWPGMYTGFLGFFFIIRYRLDVCRLSDSCNLLRI